MKSNVDMSQKSFDVTLLRSDKVKKFLEHDA